MKFPARRIKGRCYFCGSRTKAFTCVSCRPLTANDPYLNPEPSPSEIRSTMTTASHYRTGSLELAAMRRRAQRERGT